MNETSQDWFCANISGLNPGDMVYPRGCQVAYIHGRGNLYSVCISHDPQKAEEYAAAWGTRLQPGSGQVYLVAPLGKVEVDRNEDGQWLCESAKVLEEQL